MTERGRTIARWAGMGALSGTLAALAIVISQLLDFYDALDVTRHIGYFEISINPLSIAPGLAFGLIVGHALKRRGELPGWRYPAYIAAATISYFLTVQFTLNILVGLLEDIFFVIGIVAGALGAALLGWLTTILAPRFRRRATIIPMILSGAVLGALLFPALMLVESIFGWFVLFVPWQAGYAAAMATALGDPDHEADDEESRSGT